MTTELEQEFFKVFGIEPECSIEDVKNVKCVEKKCKDCIFCMKPEITAEILIELIEVLREHYKLVFWGTGDSKCLDICGSSRSNVYFRTCNNLKNMILNSLICMQEENKNLKNQVRALFGGEE